MTREEQLKFCKKCTHRKLDIKLGLICSLTNRKADFEASCNNFDVDEIVEKQLKERVIENQIANKGKLKAVIIVLILIGLSLASMIFAHLTFRDFTTKEISKELIRFALELGIYYAILKGKKWARVIITILFSFGILISFIAIISFCYTIVNLVFMALILSYAYAIYFFNADKDFKIYFESQK